MADSRLTGSLPEVRFRILGPMAVEADGGSGDGGPRKQRIVLAALLCNANSAVSVEALAEALWLGSPPRTARKNIQVYLSTLRGMAGAEGGLRISHRAGGYVLHVDPWQVDSLRFALLVREAARLRRAASSAAVAEALAAALGLWRGRALDGMRDVPLLATAGERLDRQFLGALEDWAEAELDGGGATGVVERVAEVAQQHPLRERLRILQMTALCQAGRRAEALAVYDELRRLLAHELGLSPSPALEEFYQSVLHGRPSMLRPAERPPCRLPWVPPEFTGREEATGQLADAVAGGRYRLAVVAGPLGVGKTALAVRAGHRLGDRFPDGRFFVRLHDAHGRLRRPEQLLADVDPGAELLAQAAQPARSVRSASGADRDGLAGPPRRGDRVRTGHQAWQQWLAGRRALVILDDARRESDVRPLLPDSGDSAVIVTARCRLAGLEGAWRLTVPPFTPAEAADYLAKTLGADRVAADPESAERIAQAAGLLPLGLRLVAERLALLRHVPLREYAARITGSRSLLDELSAGDLKIRPHLAEAISELPRPARRSVTRLGTLSRAVFTLSEAAAALGADETTAVRVLETLLEASLITAPSAESLAHAVRYAMPPLTYAYVREVATARPGGPGAR